MVAAVNSQLQRLQLTNRVTSYTTSAKRPPTAREVDVFRTSNWQCPETVRKSSGSRPPAGRLPECANFAMRAGADRLTQTCVAVCACAHAQNNVEAAESEEAEELLTDAPPWCYNEDAAITACSPVTDRVLRSGIYELEVMPLHSFSHTPRLRASPTKIHAMCIFSTGVAAPRSLLLPVEDVPRPRARGRVGGRGRVQGQHHRQKHDMQRRGLRAMHGAVHISQRGCSRKRRQVHRRAGPALIHAL